MKLGLDILSVKKDAKLSMSEIAGVEESKSEQDMFTVCQSRLGLSEDEETRLE